MSSAVVACVLIVAGVYIAVRMIGYVSTSAKPVGFYYDLGVNDLATEYMRHAIHSWPDFLDNLGWASWGDVPSLNLNPSLSYLALVPIADALGSEWQSVKTVQVLEQIVAFFSIAALYATLRPRDMWALVAGLLYAVLPATALTIRGNVDIGWVIALAPLSLAACYQLVRRYDIWALPLCGLICGLFGFCFAAEYLFLTSIPAYLFTCAIAFRRTRAVSFVFLSIVGFACVGGIGAFFLLPTFGDQALFSDSAVRTFALQNGTQLALFSESWTTLFALIPREFVVSDVAAFNAAGDLAILYPAALAVWLVSLWVGWVAIRSPNWALTRTVVALGVVLVVISLGTTLPLGAQLWHVLAAVPGFVLIRTPDRFLVLPLALLTLAVAAGLSRLSRMQHATAQFGAIALLVMIVCSFLAFDTRQSWLALEKRPEDIEPELERVGAAAAYAGGRTISYAFLRNGSQFFTSAYGVPTPTIWYFWDPSSHYATDGLRGYGIFMRGAVHTVIASPNWSYDSPNLPDARQIDQAFRGPIVLAGTSGIVVKKIGDRMPLSVVQATCVVGGPGLLDWADALPALRGFAFVRDSSRCERHAYLNYDPREVFEHREIARYSAGDLFADEPPLRDADYAFIVGRIFINDAWYRSSVDGDDALSLGGARNLTHGRAFALLLPGNPQGADRELLVRLASRVSTKLVSTDMRGYRASVAITPGFGLRWYRLALPHDRASETISLRFGSFPVPSIGMGTWEGIAFDRAAVVEKALPEPGRDGGSEDAALFSVASLATPRSGGAGRDVPLTYDGNGNEYYISDASGALSMQSTSSRRNGVPLGVVATGTSGSFLEHAFSARAAASSATVRVDSYGKAGAILTLVCGSEERSVAIVPPATALSVHATALRSCRTRVAWRQNGTFLTAMRFSFAEAGLPDARRNIWIPAGKFNVELYATGLKLRSLHLTVDGRPVAPIVSFAHSGYHEIVLTHLGLEDRILAFVGTGARSHGVQPASAARDSTFDWVLRNNHNATIELASFDDGRWRLDEAATGKNVAYGLRCDLVNTCFTDIPPGRYRIHHTWQPLLGIGLLGTVLTVLVTITTLLLSISLRTRSVRTAA